MQKLDIQSFFKTRGKKMDRITKYFFILFLFLTFSQCIKFKDSVFDSNGTLSNLLFFQRALSYNSGFQVLIKLKLTKADGTSYNNMYAKAASSLSTSASEKGIYLPKYTENSTDRLSFTNSAGELYLYFDKAGTNFLELYNDTSSSASALASVSFRVHNSLTKNNFLVTKIAGDLNVEAQSIQLLTGNAPTFSNPYYRSLGEANGRIYGSIDLGESSGIFSTYIVSSADGILFDRVTKIKGITGISYSNNTTSYDEILLSRPVYNGSEVVFFIRKERFVSGTSVSNYYIKISETTPAKEVDVEIYNSILSTTNQLLTKPDLNAVTYFNNRYIVAEYSSNNHIVARDLSGSIHTDLTSSCTDSLSGIRPLTIFKFTTGGSDYLFCAQDTPNGTTSGIRRVVKSDFTNVTGGTLQIFGNNNLTSRIMVIDQNLVILQNVASTLQGFVLSGLATLGTAASITFTTSTVAGLSYTPSSLNGNVDSLDRVIQSGSKFYILVGVSSSAAPVVFQSTDNGVNFTAASLSIPTVLNHLSGIHYQYVDQSLEIIGPVNGSTGSKVSKLKSDLTWTSPIHPIFMQLN
jgi:hypothetical protein